MQTLLVGALLAIWWSAHATRSGRLDRALAGIGVAAAGALILSLALVTDSSPQLFRGGITTGVAVVATGLIAGVLVPGPMRWLVAQSPLPAIGRISYGLYLWHWPIYLVVTTQRTGLTGASLLTSRLAASFGAAVLSYRFVELPIRTRRWRDVRVERRVLFAGALAASTALVATSAYGGQALTTQPADSLAALSSQPTRPRPPPPPSVLPVLLAGDSVAFSLGFWGGAEAIELGLSPTGSAILGCGIARGALVARGVLERANPSCETWPMRYQEAVQTSHPQISVLLIGAFEVYDRVVDGQLVHFGTPAMATYLQGELDIARRVLTAGGAPLVLLTVPCFQPVDQQLDASGSDERGPHAGLLAQPTARAIRGLAHGQRHNARSRRAPLPRWPPPRTARRCRYPCRRCSFLRGGRAPGVEVVGSEAHLDRPPSKPWRIAES